MANPYSLTFGKQPESYISRLEQTNSIVEAFSGENPVSQAYIVTGIRGSGKTVLMADVSKQFEAKKDWIVVELNPERDLLDALAAHLYSRKELQMLFVEAEIDLSFLGLGLSIKNSTPITDIEVALGRMLDTLKKHNKKLLICIDEVTASANMKAFVSAFQIMVRKDYDVFLLMTGLYENVDNLQNADTLTFLYRAPKVHLAALNIGAIQRNYETNFNLSDEAALTMARKTKGYAFAFQALGYVTWENREKSEGDIEVSYRQYLEEFVFEKIWSELSNKDRQVLCAIGTDDKVAIKDVREAANMSSSLFSTYRERLSKKGIIDTSEYGYVQFALPEFAAFVKRKAIL